MEFEVVMVMLVLLEMCPTNPPTEYLLPVTMPSLTQSSKEITVGCSKSCTNPMKPPTLQSPLTAALFVVCATVTDPSTETLSAPAEYPVNEQDEPMTRFSTVAFFRLQNSPELLYPALFVFSK